MSAPDTDRQNIKEFNEIAGLILDKLHAFFPRPSTLDPREIMHAMALTSDDLPSGAKFGDVFGHTLQFLIREKYVDSLGQVPAARDVLTAKGLAALRPIASELASVSRQPPSEDRTRKYAGVIGDFIGSLFGGLTKSMSSGA
jgi:hypothetical protein